MLPPEERVTAEAMGRPELVMPMGGPGPRMPSDCGSEAPERTPEHCDSSSTQALDDEALQPRAEPRSQLLLPTGSMLQPDRLDEQPQPMLPRNCRLQAERLVLERSHPAGGAGAHPYWVVEEVIDFGSPAAEESVREYMEESQNFPRPRQP